MPVAKETYNTNFNGINETKYRPKRRKTGKAFSKPMHQFMNQISDKERKSNALEGALGKNKCNPKCSPTEKQITKQNILEMI
jgi:hypothetical protein